MPRTVIGVDPGGRYAGVVARRGRALVYAATVTRRSLDRQQFAAELVDTVGAAVAAAVAAADPLDLLDDLLVAVEDVNEPTPHLGVIALEPILTTAVLLGAVLGAYRDAVVVPPGDNGSGPLRSYPAELVGPAETTGTSGKRRHMRSAWDVAGVAALLAQARHR